MNSTYKYKVFTIANGKVTEGALIEDLILKGANVTVPAVIVGEEGRGRERGVMTVSNPPMKPCPNREYKPGPFGSSLTGKTCPKCGVELTDGKHPADRGQVYDLVRYASIGETKAGKPKLIAASAATETDGVLVVFRTPIGFRGSNSHTGDRDGKDGDELKFLPFPGKMLVTGHIAQGAAGRAGGGTQMVAIVPKDRVFRTGYGGRRYGAPMAHYYTFDGQKILAATWEERSATDLF